MKQEAQVWIVDRFTDVAFYWAEVQRKAGVLLEKNVLKPLLRARDARHINAGFAAAGRARDAKLVLLENRIQVLTHERQQAWNRNDELWDQVWDLRSDMLCVEYDAQLWASGAIGTAEFADNVFDTAARRWAREQEAQAV